MDQNDEAKSVLGERAPLEDSQETLSLLKILALGNQDVEAGRVKPVADVVARLRELNSCRLAMPPIQASRP